LSFQDMQGNELARIQQKLLSFSKKYDITRDGNTVATIKKSKFTLFRDKFSIDTPAGGDLSIRGNIFDHEYEFTRDGRTIANVSKKLFSLSDVYGIDVVDGEDDVLILCAAVVIDLCSHDGRD